MSRKVTVGPDASNPNNRRIVVDGSQWCKVYGFNQEQVEERAQIIADLLVGEPSVEDGEAPTLQIYEQVEDADRIHVPHMERWAYNQMPKAGYTEVKLFRYVGTDLYIWFGIKKGSVFSDPATEPFIIRRRA